MHLGRVDSTQAEATRRAPDLAGPTWITADQQTAGRGRRGRAWISPADNFTATLLLRPKEAPEEVALRTFVASLALFDAFVGATGRTQGFSLKWPNDVMLNGGKVAGILLESVGRRKDVAHLAIGIGVNLVAAPDASDLEEGAVPPVSLASETGVKVTPGEFLHMLVPAYAKYQAQFTTYGFAPIREAWLARAARLGEVITARAAGNTWTGTFETIDNSGNLVLKTPEGRKAIPAADVFF